MTLLRKGLIPRILNILLYNTPLGGLSLKTAFNLGVVPDVQSLTSVADNFENGCAGMVDNLCAMNPATNVLKCISSKADVCQYVSLLFRFSMNSNCQLV